jgi:hypothetical protein
VDDAERRITILEVFREDPHRHEIVDVLEGAYLGHDLSMDRPQVFRSPADRGEDTRFFERFLQGPLHLEDFAFSGLPSLAKFPAERFVVLGLQELEREILQFPPDCGHAQAMGERCVDLTGFLSDAASLLVRQMLQRPHVVEAVRELDQDDPRITGHREQHLPIVLDLLLGCGTEANLSELRNAVDDLCYLGSELLLDLAERDVGVLDDVVDRPCYDRVGIEAELRKYRSNFDRVGDIFGA